MSWSSSGFARIHNWSADASAGIDILATRMDEDTDDIVNGIDQCINKAGLNAATANLGMGGYRHLSVMKAEAHDEYARVDQVQNNQFNWGGTSTGDAVDYVLTGVGGVGVTTDYPAFPHLMYPQGAVVYFKPNATNTGAATLSVNGGDAEPIFNQGAALTGQELVIGACVAVIWDSYEWNLLSPPGEGASIGFFPAGARIQLVANQVYSTSGAINTISWPDNATNWDDGAGLADPFYPGEGTGGDDKMVIPTIFTDPLQSNQGRFQLSAALLVAASSADVVHEAWFEVEGLDFFASGATVTHYKLPTSVFTMLHLRSPVELTAGDEIKVMYKYIDIAEASQSLMGESAINSSCWFEIRRIG